MKDIQISKDWQSVESAATLLGISREAVHLWIGKNLFHKNEIYRVGARNYIISTRAIQRLLETRSDDKRV